MNRTLHPLSLAIWLTMASPAALAETLDFRQSVELALAQNPDMAVTRSQIEQAEAAVRQAEGNRLPRLNLSLTGTRSNDALNAFGIKLGQRRATFGDFGAGEFDPANPGVLSIKPHDLNHPGSVNNLNTRIELQIPVYNGGMVKSYIETARAYVRAAQAGDDMARQKLIKEVLMAYQGVHTARAYVKVAEEAQKAAQEYVRITEKLHQQGMAVKSDVLTAKVNLADVKVKLASAKNAEANALDQLRLLLGKPLDAPLDVGPSVMPGLPDGDDAALRQQALDANAGVRALRNQLNGAAYQVKAAQAGKLPQFNMVLRQDWNDKGIGFDASSYTVAGVLNWTAFDGGTTDAAVGRAEAQRGELAAKLRQAESGVAYQVSDSRRRALEAQETIAAREAALEQADEAQRLVKKRYENGVATLIELLSAQAQLDRARADLVAARYQLAVERAELKRVLGQMSAESL